MHELGSVCVDERNDWVAGRRDQLARNAINSKSTLEDRCGDCPGRFVCRCLQVTEAAVTTAVITQNVCTVQDLCRLTGAGAGCTACHRLLGKYLERHGHASASASPICSVK